MRRLVGTLVILVLGGWGLAARDARAQDASSGTIAGVVRDEGGGVLPGVTVEAASPALIEKVRTSVTDDEGRYRLIDLRPGIYTITLPIGKNALYITVPPGRRRSP